LAYHGTEEAPRRSCRLHWHGVRSFVSYGNNKNNNNIGPEGSPTGFFSQM